MNPQLYRFPKRKVTLSMFVIRWVSNVADYITVKIVGCCPMVGEKKSAKFYV